jgi:hypothetical protein
MQNTRVEIKLNKLFRRTRFNESAGTFALNISYLS